MPDDRQPPPETPGPSVNPVSEPESETERAERAEATVPEPRKDDDPLVAEQEAAAAAEAAAIGGRTPDDAGGEPAAKPIYEAGGGEQEGFEAAESDLIEQASHGESRGNPERDAISPEVEADRSGAADATGNRRPRPGE
jgi:hypothetical protein